MHLSELIEEDSRIKNYEKNIEYTRELILEKYEELKEEEKTVANSLELQNRCGLEVISFFKSLNFRETTYTIGSNINSSRTFKFKDTLFQVTFNKEYLGRYAYMRINMHHLRTSNRYNVLFELNEESKLKVTRKIKLMLNDKIITDDNLKNMVLECNNLEKLRNLESEIRENTNHIKMGIKEHSLKYVYKAPNVEDEFETFGQAFENIEF